MKKFSVKGENSKIKKTLIINTLGILIILFLSDIPESHVIVFYLFNILFIIINLSLLIFMDRLSSKINFVVLLLASVIAFFTAYDYYMQGSQTVYLFWILFGFIYLGLAVFKELPKLKTG
jgi:hypothetical protein